MLTIKIGDLEAEISESLLRETINKNIKISEVEIDGFIFKLKQIFPGQFEVSEVIDFMGEDCTNDFKNKLVSINTNL